MMICPWDCPCVSFQWKTCLGLTSCPPGFATATWHEGHQTWSATRLFPCVPSDHSFDDIDETSATLKASSSEGDFSSSSTKLALPQHQLARPRKWFASKVGRMCCTHKSSAIHDTILEHFGPLWPVVHPMSRPVGGFSRLAKKLASGTRSQREAPKLETHPRTQRFFWSLAGWSGGTFWQPTACRRSNAGETNANRRGGHNPCSNPAPKEWWHLRLHGSHECRQALPPNDPGNMHSREDAKSPGAKWPSQTKGPRHPSQEPAWPTWRAQPGAWAKGVPVLRKRWKRWPTADQPRTTFAVLAICLHDLWEWDTSAPCTSLHGLHKPSKPTHRECCAVVLPSFQPGIEDLPQWRFSSNCCIQSCFSLRVRKLCRPHHGCHRGLSSSCTLFWHSDSCQPEKRRG